MGNKGQKSKKYKKTRAESQMSKKEEEPEKVASAYLPQSEGSHRSIYGDRNVAAEVEAVLRKHKVLRPLDKGYVQTSEDLEQIRISKELSKINNRKYGNSPWFLEEDSSYEFSERDRKRKEEEEKKK
jgi:hypothetical protein